MPRKRQPVAVLRANGSRHYTKAELEQRERLELKAPYAEHVPTPSYLSASLAKKFEDLAPALVQMGVLSALDGDGLARYLIAEQNYLRATSRLTAAMNAGNTAEADRWASMQDRFFRQCRAAGTDLGLTVSARCSLQIPSGAIDETSGEEMDLFGES